MRISFLYKSGTVSHIILYIEFGKNSINCQARSCALYNYLIQNGELEHYLGVMENIETQDNKKEIEKHYEEVFIKSVLM